MASSVEGSTTAQSNSVSNYDDISSHSYDRSVQDTLNEFNGIKNGGGLVSGQALDKALSGLADYGQVTREEYMDLREWVGKNWDNLSAEAKAKWTAFDGAVQDASGAPTWDNRAEIAISGSSLTDAVRTAQAAGGESDNGSDGIHVEGGNKRMPTPADVPAPQTDASSETSAVAGGDWANMSWEAIFMMIMEKIGEKEKELKGKAGAIAEKVTKAGGEGKDATADKDLMEVNGLLKKLEQMTTMVSNLQKTTHDTSMSIIRSMA
jgi:predicted heme/steroid binding protein